MMLFVGVVPTHDRGRGSIQKPEPRVAVGWAVAAFGHGIPEQRHPPLESGFTELTLAVLVLQAHPEGAARVAFGVITAADARIFCAFVDKHVGWGRVAQVEATATSVELEAGAVRGRDAPRIEQELRGGRRVQNQILVPHEHYPVRTAKRRSGWARVALSLRSIFRGQ